MANIYQIIDEIKTISMKPQNPWIGYRLVSEFAGFPNDIAGVIVDYLSTMKLRNWINAGNLEIAHLVINPNALLAGMIPNLNNAPPGICANPLAFDHVKRDPDRYLLYMSKWISPPLAEWLLSIGIHPSVRSYYYMSFCESKITIQWILDNIPKSDAIGYLSVNPMAIDVLRQNLNRINSEHIWCNCAAVDILQNRLASGSNICWKWLSRNRSQ